MGKLARRVARKNLKQNPPLTGKESASKIH
jgi:uncharacterized protein YneF (UPF0154 family)